jgi:UDP-glucose 4-epimerase
VVLITGGMGFIGLHTARRFLDAGETVVLTRYRALREPSFLKGEPESRMRVEFLDLADGWALLDVLRRHHVTSIVHLASPPLNAAPAQAYGTGLRALVNVLEAGRQHGVSRITVASSVSVYADAGRGPWHEEMPLPVESPNYTAAAKKAAEILTLHFGDRTGLDVVALRLAGIYGPLYHSMANLPSRLCHAAVRGGEADLEGLRSGLPYAEAAGDLCYVRDCATGIQLVHTACGLPHRIYNVGGGRPTTNSEVASAVARVVPGVRFVLPPGRSPGAETAYMDLTRVCRDAGYKPAFDVAAGIAEYVEWLRSNPE